MLASFHFKVDPFSLADVEESEEVESWRTWGLPFFSEGEGEKTTGMTSSPAKLTILDE